MRNWLLPLLLPMLLFAPKLIADEPAVPPGLQEVPEPPELPSRVESGEVLEPEVTIVPQKEGTVEEYRINGVLYMVKVIPKKGPPYYLIDNDGDGVLESRRSQLYDNYNVPQWVIFSWD
jgi:hypothetical protein